MKRGFLRPALAVLRKELKDSSRDRRALMTIAFTALLSPVLVGVMMNRLADRQREADAVRIPVVGMEHAPALIDWLRQQPGVEVAAGPSDAEVAVRDRNEPVARIVSLVGSRDEGEELLALASQGKLRLGQGVLEESFWEMPAPRVPAAALRRAVEKERDEN